MCLELKKSIDPNEDAYFKDFLDILDTDAGEAMIYLLTDSVRIKARD